MLETFTARIDSVDVPCMTMERAVDRCRKMANDLGRTIILSALVKNKYVQLGTYEPMPLELMPLKTAAMHMGDIYACLAHPRIPKSKSKKS